MARLSPARRCALAVLMDAEQSGRYVRELMPGAAEAAALDTRDAAFALRLALGVSGTRGCLDDALAPYLHRARGLEPCVRMALRISTFEALYFMAAPEVVVSQGVELVRGVSFGAAGLANAVLRRVCEGRAAFLAAEDADPAQRAMVSRARRSGLPVWLVRRMVASLGETRAEGALSSQLEPAPTAVHVNALRDAGDFSWLDEPGVDAGVLPGCYEGVKVAALVACDAFARADAVASDLHSQLIAAAATRPGTCLEIGAGRGTKTFMMHCHAHRAGFARTHVALDLHEGKCRSNAERIERAGFGTLATCAGDATDLSAVLASIDEAAGERVRLDTVFVDAPCSGTGTMRRHSEIAWRLAVQDVDRDLPELQRALLRQAAMRVARGGELIYATCSVLEAENAGVVDAFLASEDGRAFRLELLSDAEIFQRDGYAAAGAYVRSNEDGRGLFRTAPAPRAYDGHFCARLKRID